MQYEKQGNQTQRLITFTYSYKDILVIKKEYYSQSNKEGINGWRRAEIK